MRTLQEKYNAIQEGKFSKDHFLAEARMQQPQLVTRFNGYDDAVQILKNKGMIVEAISTDAAYVHQITGCGQDAAQNFIDDNTIDSKKLADYVKQHKDSKEKYDVRDIIAGTGVGENKGFKARFIKQLKETVTEGKDVTKLAIEYILGKDIAKYHDEANNYAYQLPGSTTWKTISKKEVDKTVADHKDSLLKEAKLTKKSLTDYRYKPTNDMDKYPYEQILRGLRVELESMKVTDTPTAEEYQKAIAKVAKNLEKDSIFYTNQLAGFNPNKKRTDVMTPVDQKKIFKTNGTKGEKATDNKDVDNGMKKLPVTTNFTIVKEGIKKVIKSILKEDEDWDKSGRHIEYGVPEHGDEDDLYDLYGNDEENLEEGPAQNNPKIQKLVDGINDLIRQAKDSDGDPIGVVEPGGTWEEPEMYSPIEYTNGALKITKMSPYKGIPSTDVIKAGNMEFDGLPTLRLIMRMYKKAVKKAGQDAYPDENLDEASYEEEAVDPLRDYKQATEQVTEGKTRVNDLFAALDAKGFSPEQIQDTAFLAKKIDNIMWTLNDVADNPEELAKRYQDRVSNMNEDSDGDYEHDKDVAGEAERLYDAGYAFFLKGRGKEAEALRQAALKKASWLSWGEDDLPPYTKDGEEVADDISHPRGYEEASDAETEEDLYKEGKSEKELRAEWEKHQATCHPEDKMSYMEWRSEMGINDEEDLYETRKAKSLSELLN